MSSHDQAQKSVHILLAILSGVVLMVVLAMLLVLYSLLAEQKREQMVIAAKSKASLIEAVAGFDAIYSDQDVSGGAQEATLMQIREAQEVYQGFGRSGEFNLARLTEDKRLEYVLQTRSDFASQNGAELKLNGEHAVAMQQALMGRSGSIIAQDYRGVLVLAAYEPLPKLGLGMVVKMDMAEIRQPFIDAAFLSLFLAIIINLLGIVFIKRVTKPIIDNIAEKRRQLRTFLATSGEPIFTIDDQGICTFANQACVTTLGLKSYHALVGKRIAEMIYSCKESGKTPGERTCSLNKPEHLQEVLFRDGEFFWKADGTSIAVEYRSNPIVEHGSFKGAVVTFQDISQRKAQDAEKARLMHDMGERIKELQCIYAITLVLRRHQEVEPLLQEVVKLLPPGWHYPEFTRAKITFNEQTYRDLDFTETEWCQSSDLLIGDQVVGSVEIYYVKAFPPQDEGPFLIQERRLIDSIAIQISEAIERIQALNKLEHMAVHDALTGLANRQTLTDQMEKEVYRASRYGHPLAVLMFDLDHFKQVNDEYGHHAGDLVLKRFAHCLQTQIRETDFAVRFGGEEFMVVLPETPLSEAQLLAERIRSVIASLSIDIDGGQAIKITCSVGIASYPEHSNVWQELIVLADKALYSAKESGRNCTVAYTAENR